MIRLPRQSLVSGGHWSQVRQQEGDHAQPLNTVSFYNPMA
jgi:hypothetical protein